MSSKVASTSTSTPQKRKAEIAILTPSSERVKVKQRINPNPFPTPSSRSQCSLASSSLPIDSNTYPHLQTTSLSSSSPTPKRQPLPSHLRTLLSLHSAFNLALSLHIATHPPVLPPHDASATRIDLINLTNYLAIKETVERTSRRRFGLPELSRLVWVWSWDGETLPADNGKDDENPFLVKPLNTETRSDRVGGLSFVITPTRTLDPTSGRKVYTHGLGIELEIAAGETRQLLLGGAEGGAGNKGQGGGVRAISRWNANGEMREEAFRLRLERWIELHGGYEEAEGQPGLPTPTSRDSLRSIIPPIPVAKLPSLPSSSVSSSLSNLFNAASSLTSTPGLTSLNPLTSSPQSSLKAAGTSAGTGLGSLSDPFELEIKTKPKAAPTGSVEERRQALYDRIKARTDSSKAARTTLGSAVSAGIKSLTPAGQQEELKRRSTLSRLESVAEAVWMLFSGPSPGSSSLPTPPRGRRKAIPMSEVADMLVKSSKTPISFAEAQTSLQLLAQLCPFFLIIKTVGRHDWLEMPRQVAAAPPSPGSGGAGMVGEVRVAPPSPGSTLAGPASPGRVRRVGGLREVRERIRRELGE